LTFSELIGVVLVGYGIWFAGKGVQKQFGSDKTWWRPLTRSERYPYPAAGVLLGIVFALLGLRFALDGVWAQAAILAWVGGGVFILVLVIGVVQPRFLHPRWYGVLEDRFGRKAMARLKGAAVAVPVEEWIEIRASDSALDAWANRVMPDRRPGRGYAKDLDRE
jgi:hypothetical protein